jgi:hypothetical protein
VHCVQLGEYTNFTPAASNLHKSGAQNVLYPSFVCIAFFKITHEQLFFVSSCSFFIGILIDTSFVTQL